jgi:hypothetical protein
MQLEWVLFVVVINTSPEVHKPILMEPFADKPFPSKELCELAEGEATLQLGRDTRINPGDKMLKWGGETRVGFDCLPRPYVDRDGSMRQIELWRDKEPREEPA